MRPDGAPWSTLIAAATLGVARAAASPATSDLWPPGLPPVPAGSAEKTLLRAAAATYLWQLAGARAACGARPEIPPSPPASQATVSEEAARRLARLLAEGESELVLEWLALAAHAGRVLPGHWLPTVLEALRAAERARHAAVLGPRALWLAQLNARWAMRALDTAPSEERWASGTLEERVGELRALRGSDPDRARAWLEETWPTDPPEARAQLARVLLTNLSARDEPFLERALDDRRREVRVIAVEGLTRLQQSAHARRNLARAEPLIRAEPAAPGTRARHRLVLRIKTPAQLDHAALRDGIEARRPARLKIGERAHWLWQIVARIPPSHWTERFACDAATFLDAVAATEYGAELLEAFTAAAQVHPCVPWASALCQRWLASHEAPTGERRHALSSLIGSLHGTDQELVLQEVLGAAGGQLELLDEVLGDSRITWSASSTALAMARLREAVTASLQMPSGVMALMQWSLHADVPVASAALAEIRAQRPPDSSWHKTLESMAWQLDARAAMRKEIFA